MFKTYQTEVRRRGRYYFVIVNERRGILGLLGVKFMQTGWRETRPRFLSRNEAFKLADNIRAYLKGKYVPVSTIE